MSALVKYDQARQALAACRSVDEIKDIRDKSEAMRLYAKQAQDTELEQWAAEIKLRAQRAIGELSAALETQKGGFGIVPTGGKHKAEVLADAGISTSTANRYEKLAAIPEPVVEAVIAESREAGKPVSAKVVMARATPKPATMPPRAAAPAKPVPAVDAPSPASASRATLQQQVQDQLSAADDSEEPEEAPPGDMALATAGADDGHGQLLDDYNTVKRERDALQARVQELEDLLALDDAAAQVDALRQKCAQFDSLATARFAEIAELQGMVKRQRDFLDGLRRAAGLPKGGDLAAWIKVAAQRAA